MQTPNRLLLSSLLLWTLNYQAAVARGELATPPDEQAKPKTSIPAQPNESQEPPPDMPSASKRSSYLIQQPVTFVEIPVTVKDQENRTVSGLTFRDFQIRENGQPQHLKFFSVDATPLSLVFVIDQGVSRDVMQKIDESLSAIPGSLASGDEAAIVTYNNGSRVITDFTGARSARLSAALETSKQSPQRMEVPFDSEPSPNDIPRLPEEAHTLHDAIFAAARMLSTRETGRHRVIYVVSDGKEQGSKARQTEVIRYLQSYQITVYGTLVDDAVTWVERKPEQSHAPLQTRDILPKYVMTTGGSWDTEFSVDGIETSYVRIAREARDRYTLGYDTRESINDGKFRSIDLHVLTPNLKVIARAGYDPSVQVLH
jgi:VWFA-related protein